MEPFDRADPSLLATLAGVVFDVDDTITRGGRIEREAFDALHDLRASGLVLVAVTGRPLGWTDVMARHLPVHIAVGENGAGWTAVVEGEVIEGHYEDAETRGRTAASLERIRLRVARELPEVIVATDQRARRCDLAFDVGETRTLDERTIAALVRILEEEGARRPVPVSSVHAHAVLGGWDKARGVARALSEVLEIGEAAARERFLFVGDSGNDAEAFGWFEHTVGVANVRDHLGRLTRPPRWVTREDRGRGFAEMARTLLAARAR